MTRKTRLYLTIGILIFCPLLLGNAELITKNQAEQERKSLERIEIMKRDPESLYFAKTETPIAEQEIIAQDLWKKIQDLSKTEGFDSPDYDKILEYAREILLKAPNVEGIQMVHWNMYTLFLLQEDDQEAGKSLESYLYKYPDDEFHVYEAYDKLSVFAMDVGDWGRALYYADKILENDPERYPLIFTKARALIRLGEKAEGKALLERIIKEDEGTVQYNLALMELDELIAAKDIKEPPLDPEEKRKATGGEEVNQVTEKICLVKPIFIDVAYGKPMGLDDVSTVNLIRYEKQPQDEGVTMKHWSGETSDRNKYVEKEKRKLNLSDFPDGIIPLEPGLYQFNHNSVNGQPPSGFYGKSNFIEIKPGEETLDVKITLNPAI